MYLASRGVIAVDLVVVRKHSHLKIHRTLHFASCFFARRHFHRYHSCLKEEIHRHWLAEAVELTVIGRSRSGLRSDDHLESFANWMKESRSHHCLSGTDPGFAGFADAVAVLESLLDVTVVDAEQGSAEQLVDSPIWLGLCFDTEVGMCQIRKGTPY